MQRNRGNDRQAERFHERETTAKVLFFCHNQRDETPAWRVGAGVEQKFGTNLFGKVEYRYSNYKEGEIDFEAEDIPDSDRFDIDTDRHQVVASVGMRF